MKGSHQLSHPFHLLDDLLASLSPGDTATAPVDQEVQDQNNDKSSPNAVATDAAAMAMAEVNQDVVLRAACDLFGNNMSLLENALALLDEQKQYQSNHCTEIDNDQTTPMTVPVIVIRKIRARRSGREAILVRKQRKKSSSGHKSKSADGISSSQVNKNDKDGKKQNIADDYYLCLLGRDRIDRRALLTNNHGWAKIHRQGAHCTCRSFFQNIKGGSRSSSAKSSEVSLPSCSNVVVCKHLLAAIIMPHLLPWSKTGGIEDEIVDDREFAKLIMRASIG
mmetsp:Transcript_6611/g.11778  ORF Transcript_6611/g.11778 Transcript_6611/m.11778 type:complete len:279 (+) Transcript_6611:238-1074(+)